MGKKIKLPVGIGGILEKVIKNLGISGPVKLIRIMTRWEKILGPPICRITFPKDLKGKTLFVDVQDSVWLQQLAFMDKMIMEKVNKAIGSKAVEKIHFSVGPIPESPGPVEDQKWALEEIMLNNEDLDEISECVSGVTDLELKKSLRRIMGKDKKLKKLRQEGKK
jgi:hypothetical protein